MATYQIPLEVAYWDYPLAAALVLMPIFAERNSTGEHSTGPNYAQEEAIKARNKCQKFLRAHYEIVPDPSLPWVLA